MRSDVRVDRMLDISSGHVTQSTCNDYNEFVLARYEYGVIFFLPFLEDGKIAESVIKSENIPDDLLAVFNFAIANECDYIKIDADGTIYDDDLPLYEW